MRYPYRAKNSKLLISRRLAYYIIILSGIFFIFLSTAFAQENRFSYPGIIHIHSNISQSGIYSLRELTILARDKGIKILVFSDSFLKRWEYGLPVFSNIFKVSIEKSSVAKYGIRNYRNDLKKIRDEFPDMLILEGVEVAPYYWWSGNFFKKTLSLNDWDRHLLVVGLKRDADYVYLPVRANRYFLPRLKDIPLLLISVAAITTGIFIFTKKQRRLSGTALGLLGALFLLNHFPFSASRYNSHYRSKEFLPHQELINYVNKSGALTLWAHPKITEGTSWGGFAGIGFYTADYPEALTETSGYTGFGVDMSPGANQNLIFAGSQWDKVLTDYCQGKTPQPVWAVGEADYRGRSQIDAVQNIFFLPEFTQEAALEALRKGRLYIRYYSKDNIDISLADFHIENGEGKPKLHIKGNYKINPAEGLTIEVIRNGAVIQKLKFANEGIFDAEFQDTAFSATSAKSYYRLNFFAGGRIMLATNPLFIKINNE